MRAQFSVVLAIGFACISPSCDSSRTSARVAPDAAAGIKTETDVEVNVRVRRPFYSGVYIYTRTILAAAAEAKQSYGDFFATHMAILRDAGVNAIYLGDTRPELFDETLHLADEHGLRLIPQLDFAYFQPTWSNAQMAAAADRAAAFMAKYRGNPSIISYSVKEEVAPKNVARLSTYYDMIREREPEAKLNLIFNSLTSAQNFADPSLQIIGVDRYPFWWEYSADGYLASPNFALQWFRKQLPLFAKETDRQNAQFMVTATQGGLVYVQRPTTYCTNPAAITSPTDPVVQQERIDRFVGWADEGRMGWNKYVGPQGQITCSVWKYYRTPRNALKAMAWSSVMEGAQLFFVWSYSPPLKQKLQETIAEVSRRDPAPKEYTYWTLAGRPGLPNPELAEFAEANREIRRYEAIITSMTKESVSPVTITQNRVFQKSFSVPRYTGRVVVVHNANVGTWPHNSRYFFQHSDQIFVNEDGTLDDYQPLTEPLLVTPTLTNSTDDRIFDLATGMDITESGVEVAPGSGRLLYVGSAEDATQLARWLPSE